MSLKTIMREHVTSVFMNADHFTETVTFHGVADLDVECLVKTDDGLRDNEGDDQTIFTGVIDFPTTEVDALQLDSNPVLLVTVFGEVWDVIDVGPDLLGIRKIGIRRTSVETKHSNAFNLNRVQEIY